MSLRTNDRSCSQHQLKPTINTNLNPPNSNPNNISMNPNSITLISIYLYLINHIINTTIVNIINDNIDTAPIIFIIPNANITLVKAYKYYKNGISQDVL